MITTKKGIYSRTRGSRMGICTRASAELGRDPHVRRHIPNSHRARPAASEYVRDECGACV